MSDDNNALEEQAQEQAKQRYMIMNGVRVGSLAALLVGLMITRTVLPGPWVLGAVLALGGMVAFFFAPPLLAKRWKAGDRGER